MHTEGFPRNLGGPLVSTEKWYRRAKATERGGMGERESEYIIVPVLKTSRQVFELRLGPTYRGRRPQAATSHPWPTFCDIRTNSQQERYPQPPRHGLTHSLPFLGDKSHRSNSARKR